jgi:ribokinase
VTDIVTVGWLTVDDIVLPEGSCERAVLGGGALYSAVGARIWNDRVGIHAVAGTAHHADVVRGIAARGLDASGIGIVPGNGLELWLLHESETDKQQVPKLSSSTPEELDAGRGPLPQGYRAAKGFHIAPQRPQGSFAHLETLDGLAPRPVITLDILSDAYVDARLYLDLAFLDRLDAFLPSEAEVARLWRPTDLGRWAREQAAAHGCHVAVKLGRAGSLACEAGGGRLYRVPAYPARVLDTTGAGDAYCGGFLAGLVAGRPVSECAAMGTVSASYVVEARGALATISPDADERRARLARVTAGIEAHAA